MKKINNKVSILEFFYQFNVGPAPHSELVLRSFKRFFVEVQVIET